MNRFEAKEALKTGVKLTHTYFDSYEWVSMKDGRILLEDGVICDPEEFWKWRADSSFDTGWSLYIDQ